MFIIFDILDRTLVLKKKTFYCRKWTIILPCLTPPPPPPPLIIILYSWEKFFFYLKFLLKDYYLLFLWAAIISPYSWKNLLL